MASSFHLLVAIPEKDPVSYSLSGDTVSVGRSPANDIQILVREISTSHCEFTATESGYQINDKGSTNGTKVNDRSVKEPVELHTRDVILLGETVPTYFIVAEEGADIDLKAEI
ncbi:MAG: FHA domain-containing protein, partial [Verrucomicrobiales bacterium]|nr:FHA domain-containing protein [Verrucomicrobiales bacterium]